MDLTQQELKEVVDGLDAKYRDNVSRLIGEHDAAARALDGEESERRRKVRARMEERRERRRAESGRANPEDRAALEAKYRAEDAEEGEEGGTGEVGKAGEVGEELCYDDDFEEQGNEKSEDEGRGGAADSELLELIKAVELLKKDSALNNEAVDMLVQGSTDLAKARDETR
jgi:hypothetical protein